MLTDGQVPLWPACAGPADQPAVLLVYPQYCTYTMQESPVWRLSQRFYCIVMVLFVVNPKMLQSFDEQLFKSTCTVYQPHAVLLQYSTGYEYTLDATVTVLALCLHTDSRGTCCELLLKLAISIKQALSTATTNYNLAARKASSPFSMSNHCWQIRVLIRLQCQLEPVPIHRCWICADLVSKVAGKPLFPRPLHMYKHQSCKPAVSEGTSPGHCCGILAGLPVNSGIAATTQQDEGACGKMLTSH